MQTAQPTSRMTTKTSEMTHEELTERAERLALEALEDPTLIPEYLEASAQCRRIEWPCNPGRRKNGMTQQQLILNYIRKKGHITQRDAILDLGVQSITRRITDLKEAGHKIVTERCIHPATGQNYTRYSLADEKVAA